MQVENECLDDVDCSVWVQETYKNVDEPIKYDTGLHVCACRRFLKKGICLHMLFLRERMDLPAFDPKMFLRFRYLKNMAAYDSPQEMSSGILHPDNEPEHSDQYGKTVQGPDRVCRPQDRYFEVLEVPKQICEVAPK